MQINAFLYLMVIEQKSFSQTLYKKIIGKEL